MTCFTNDNKKKKEYQHYISHLKSKAEQYRDEIKIRLGRTLHWDPENGMFTNDDKANRLLSSPMRTP